MLLFCGFGKLCIEFSNCFGIFGSGRKEISKIKIADAPLVEGLIAAVAMNDTKASVEDILTELKEFKQFSK